MYSFRIFHISPVWLALVPFLLLITLDVSGQDLYYPTADSWDTKAPSELGFDESKLQSAVDFALNNEYSGSRDLRIAILESFSVRAKEPYHRIAGPTREREGPAGIIVKDGYIIAQWGDVNRVDMTFSVTKSYLSTVAGLAWDRGIIRDVTDTVGTYVWDGTFQGEHNSRITWHHLLNQSSDWSGTLWGVPDWADRPDRKLGLDDWKYRDLYEPGTHFKYNDVRVNVLAYSLLQTWRRPLPKVLKQFVMDPIGASTTWRWFGYETSWVNIDGVKVQSVSGGGHSGGGIFISTLDHARFGLLFARNGKWYDQQIISEKWIEMATQSSEANEAYGYMWWLNKGTNQVEGTSDEMFYASGFGGNYIIVDQTNDLVIVTRWLEPSKRKEFIQMVLNAMGL